MRYKLTERQSSILIELGMPSHFASEGEWKGSINSVRIPIFVITDLINYIDHSEHLKDKWLIIKKHGAENLWDVTIQPKLQGTLTPICECARNAELIDALFYLIQYLLWKQNVGAIKM